MAAVITVAGRSIQRRLKIVVVGARNTLYISRVRRRGLHYILLIFQVLWLNVVVPGHRRGIVPVPGEARQNTVVCPLCAARASASTASSRPSKSGSPCNAPEHCAICFFAAHLTLPPVVDLNHMPLRFLHRVSAEVGQSRCARGVLLPFDGRGPPCFA